MSNPSKKFERYFYFQSRIRKIIYSLLLLYLFLNLYAALYYIFATTKVDIFSLCSKLTPLSKILHDCSSWMIDFISSFDFKLIDLFENLILANPDHTHALELSETFITTTNGNTLETGEMLFTIVNGDAFEPGETLITAIGVGNLTLTTLSELSSRKHHGISLSYIIDYFFPYHKAFLILPWGFYITGLYACKIVQLDSAARCLLGIIVCTGYSLNLTWHTSAHTKNPITAKYITELTYTKIPDKITFNELLSGISFYIGQEYTQIGISTSTNLSNRFKGDINALTQLLASNFDILDKVFPEQDNKLLFKHFFSIGDSEHPKSASVYSRYVIYDFIAENKCTLESINAKFQSYISSCEIIWENIFHPIKVSNLTNLKLTAVVLTDIYQKNNAVFVPLVCGLSAYQRTIMRAEEYTRLHWAKHLESIHYYSKDLFHRKKHCTDYPYDFHIFLVLIELGTIFWEYVLDPEYPRDEYKEVTDILFSLLKDTNKEKVRDVLFSSDDLIELYLAYSYLVYKCTTPLARFLPSRSILDTRINQFKTIVKNSL